MAIFNSYFDITRGYPIVGNHHIHPAIQVSLISSNLAGTQVTGGLVEKAKPNDPMGFSIPKKWQCVMFDTTKTWLWWHHRKNDCDTSKILKRWRMWALVRTCPNTTKMNGMKFVEHVCRYYTFLCGPSPPLVNASPDYLVVSTHLKNMPTRARVENQRYLKPPTSHDNPITQL